MRRLLVLVLMTAACHGGGNSAPPDGARPDGTTADAAPVDAAPVDAAPADAMPDAGPGPSSLLVDDGNGGTPASWSFGSVALGARSGVTLVIRQGGSATSSALELAVNGPDAGDVTIGATSTCAGATLAPGDFCVVRLTFVPGATGPRSATLEVAGAGGPLDVPLVGSGVAPDVVGTDTATLDFGAPEIGASLIAHVLVSNTGSSAVTLGAPVLTTGFILNANACTTTLAATASCQITVEFVPTASGLWLGRLTVPASTGNLTVALRGVALRRLTVSITGGGAGTVTSVPPGPLYVGDATLTVTPSAGDVLAGWGPPCTGTGACVTHDGPSAAITADVATSTAKAVALTFAGAAPGVAYVIDDTANQIVTTCTSSCTAYVASGHTVSVWGFSPSTFAGWTGDCTTATYDCELGAVTANRAATGTFARDDREIATLLPGRPVNGLAFAPDGDLIVSSGNTVAKVTLAGVAVWHTTLPGPRDVATDAAGDVFGIDADGIFALSPAGVPQWTTPAIVGRVNNPLGTFDSAISVSPDGTVIAALTPDGARVVDGTGANRFTVTGVSPAPAAVAVGPDGTVGVDAESPAGGQRKVLRFDKTGTPLAALDPLPGDESASFAFDSTGAICADVTGFGKEYVSRTSAALTNVFTKVDSTGAAAAISAGITVDSTGEVVAMRGDNDGGYPGLYVQVFSATGTLGWTHEKVATQYPIYVYYDAVVPAALAADGAKHVAVAGTYSLSPGGWIQIYAMP